MLGHGAKFGHKKEQAIAALLSHRNVEEAARAIRISANTLQRWIKEPEFDAAYREARRTAFDGPPACGDRRWNNNRLAEGVKLFLGGRLICPV